MKIVKFEGATMRDAIAKVKAELGDQAVIVSTRQIRRGLLGTAYEISAAIDETEDAAPKGRGFGAMTGPTMGGPSQQRPSDEDLEKLMAPLRSELRSLRALVRAAGDTKSTTDLKTELAMLRKLVEDMRPQAVPQYIEDPHSSIDSALQSATKPRTKRETMSALTASSNARIVMLVGPTGAGKTTTIAKLAARAALIESKRVNVITLDNYRVGGVDQIRTFTDLIGVPLQVADLASLRDCIGNDELTLIDTAGRSPRDVDAIAELANAIADLPVEVHLVVPAGTSPQVIDALVLRYRALRPVRLLFTKLDEVETAPELSRAPARLELPITWITTGQAVPEDIEEPTSARVLELASAGLHRPRNRNRAA